MPHSERTTEVLPPAAYAAYLLSNKSDSLAARQLRRTLNRIYGGNELRFLTDLNQDLFDPFFDEDVMQVTTKLQLLMDWSAKKLSSVLKSADEEAVL